MKVAFLTVVPSPYMRDLFCAMHRDGRLSPQVLYTAMQTPGFDWGKQPLEPFEKILAPPRWNVALGWMPNAGVTTSLARTKADVYVICGYRLPTMQIAMRWLRRSGRPWVFFGERPGVSNRGVVGRVVRNLAMRPVVHWPHGIAAVGTLAVQAYTEKCSARVPIESLPYFTDLQPFQEHRSSAGSLPGQFRILYCGQLIARKGVDLLIDAFCHIADRVPSASLTLLGDGDQRESLQKRIPQHLKEKVNFLGFKPTELLPQYFQQADVFVLPSRHDGWGVVVNQALGAGLPVIASDRVGAALDLIENDRNGFLFPSEDREELTRILQRMAVEKGICRRLAEGAVQTSKLIDLSTGIDRWCNFLKLFAHSSASN